jgi:hypothetical protein
MVETPETETTAEENYEENMDENIEDEEVETMNIEEDSAQTKEEVKQPENYKFNIPSTT